MILWSLVHDQANDNSLEIKHESFANCSCLMASGARQQMNEIEKVPSIEFPIIDKIIAEMQASFPNETDSEKIKATYIGLFNSRKQYSQSLINGSPAELIRHIKTLETIVKVFKTCHQAAELCKIEFLNKADKDAKKAIAEEDKKYKPQFKERELEEKKKMTDAEKKISGLVKLGMNREDAEKLIFGKPCQSCGMRICQCNVQEPKVPAE